MMESSLPPMIYSFHSSLKRFLKTKASLPESPPLNPPELPIALGLNSSPLTGSTKHFKTQALPAFMIVCYP